MIQWAKFGSKVMKASKKFGKTKAGKKITKAKMTASKGLKKLSNNNLAIGGAAGFATGGIVGVLGEDPKSYNYKNKRVNKRTLERAKKVQMYG